jgi:hypothetical protein
MQCPAPVLSAGEVSGLVAALTTLISCLQAVDMVFFSGLLSPSYYHVILEEMQGQQKRASYIKGRVQASPLLDISQLV